MTAAYKGDVPVEPSKEFQPVVDPVLARRLKALKSNIPESGEVPKRLVARITRIEEQIARDSALQERAYKRAEGIGNSPRGTSSKGLVRWGVTYGRRTGVPHLAVEVFPKFTPSTTKPMHSDRRRARRAVEASLGYRLSGRQWVRLRKAVKRAMRAEVSAAMSS